MPITTALLGLVFSLQAYAATLPAAPPLEVTLEVEIEHYAREFRVDADALKATMQCESQGNVDAYNPNDPNGGSYGIFQYQIPTFYGFAKESGLFEVPDIHNPHQQAQLTAWAWSKGYQRNWSCARKLNLI